MKKIVVVLIGIMFNATLTAQNDTIKQKIDSVRLVLQKEQRNDTPEIHNSTIEVPTKLNNGIETRNTAGNEVQKPNKRFGNNSPRKPTTDEINAREAAKLNTPTIRTSTNSTTPVSSTRTTTTTNTRTDSTQTVAPAKVTRKGSSKATSARKKASNTKTQK